MVMQSCNLSKAKPKEDCLWGAGTLYGALKTLLEKGWIEEASEIEERKKEYQITPKGKEIVEKELQRLYSLCEIAGKIMGGKQE